MKLKFLAVFGLAATLCSCDDETVGIGQFIVDDELIDAKAASYNVTTQSLLLDSVYSRSSTAYLGKFTDKDYGTFSSDFLVQINCPENFSLPDKLEDIVEAKLGLYYTDYFGDSLSTLRVQVDTLNTVIKDDGKDKNLYYSNLDPKKYYDATTPFLAVKDYAAYDKTVSDSIRNATDSYGNKTYYPNVSVDLGKDFCKYLLDKYNETKEVNGQTVHPNFRDSEAFIKNVLKGFYVHTTQGEGSILYVSDIYLSLKLSYWDKTDEDKDTLLTGYVQMASTKEVFMSSRFKNANLDELKSDPERTYLKTPAGICTEVTLPLKDMFDAHQKDTLNSISVSFQKLKSQEAGPFKMGTPSRLLMVRKSDMKSFFEDNKVNDNKTSFIASYDSKTATYQFSKLNRLTSYIFSEIRPEVEKGEAAWNKWVTEHPDWNKVVLIPVTTESDSQGNIIGVEKDLNVNSAMLVRGVEGDPSSNEENQITMNVIYTQPKQR